jgi:hypothetical protein
MKTFRTLAFTALVGVSAIAMTSSASARIVCNEAGDCWHTQTDYVYPPTLGLSIHDNDWKWKEGEKHMWREHEGKGYWKIELPVTAFSVAGDTFPVSGSPGKFDLPWLTRETSRRSAIKRTRM